jgi:hypothetical protein
VDRPVLGWQGRFFLHDVAHYHVIHHVGVPPLGVWLFESCLFPVTPVPRDWLVLPQVAVLPCSRGHQAFEGVPRRTLCL